ncbi:MAG: hypothetical protein IT184_16075 [Acidobacteria bacterium]|nr:hypothetical protein [Acidobacteriota bacterium]
MKRRQFLVGAAAGAAAVVGATGQGLAQAPAAAQGRAGGPAPGPGRGGGRGGSPANVPAAKLDRIAIMSLNHGSMLKLPWNASPNPNQTLDLFDLPQYYVDVYGVRNLEFQHSHLAQNQDNPDPEVFRQMKARLDAIGSRANQINIEIGSMAQMQPDGKAAALSGDVRAAWIARGKKWIDLAPVLGIKRLMLNQGSLNDDSKAGVISLWKELQDYAKPKGIMMSNETRGSGAPVYNPGRGQAGAPPTPPPAPPQMSETERLRYVWGILAECAEAAGAYTNLDFGGAGRFKTQQQLHDAIKGMMKTNSGSMHIKSSPDWDIGRAVAYSESLGYKGLYTIEVNPDPAVRIVYNTILANVT